MSEPALLEVHGVTKRFGAGASEAQVLRGIDLSVQAGEFVALVGPSGSGKSTLLHILGLLQTPSEGTVRLSGLDTSALDDAGRARLRRDSLGFVFQFHHLIPSLTAEENVRIPLALASGSMRATLRPRALASLRAVGLEAKADASSRTLSGGEQQRVAVARALVAQPGLVFADEPTGNLDTENAEQVFRLFRRMHAERNTAFVIVTHDVALAARCDRVVTLVDGRVTSDLRTSSGAA